MSAFNNQIPAQITAPFSKRVRFTLPASLSGIYEFKVIVEGTAFAVAAGSGQITPNYSGQVTPWNDIYASSDDTTDKPSFYANAVSTNLQDATSAIQIARFKVLQATAGTNNYVELFPGGNFTVGTITQTYMEIREIGSAFQTSNSINSPVFINSSGQVVDPTKA